MNETPFQPLDADLPGEELSNDQLYITEEICQHWRETSRWTYNTAIAGYIVLGLSATTLCYLVMTAPSISWLMVGILITFVSTLSSICRNMYRYSVNIRKAADDAAWEDMETAFSSLKKAYSAYGGFIVVVTVIALFTVSYYVINIFPVISNAL